MPFLTQDRTNWKYILIVLVLAAIIVGWILVWQYLVPKEEASKENVPEVKVPEEVTEDETAGWKTYRNEEYGFEFKYPAHLILKEREEYKFEEWWITLLWAPPEEVILPLSISFYIQHEEPILHWGEDPVFSEDIIVGGINFRKNYFVTYTGYGGQETNYVIKTHTKMSDRYYVFILRQASPERITIDEALSEMRDENNEFVKIFNQILSTFRFLE